MRELAAWTALTLDTPNPVPFGAEIFHSKSGESLMRAANAVGEEHDPSAHAEVRTIRLACNKLNSYWLRGTRCTQLASVPHVDGLRAVG